jgi:hypothetical protein
MMRKGAWLCRLCCCPGGRTNHLMVLHKYLGSPVPYNHDVAVAVEGNSGER